jgi:hypothetical protein
MGDQIGFHEAWFGFIPILERAHRDLLFEQRSRPGRRDPAPLLFSVGA